MRAGYDENPLNPVPPVVWLIALPVILSEAAFGLAQAGFIGGGQYSGGVLRQLWVERTALAPEALLRMWQWGEPGAQLYRLLSYPFVHYSFTHAVFVTVFLLALGNMVARQIRPLAVLCIFFGATIAGAAVYTLGAALLPTAGFGLLVGGYPGVYGLLGAFTFLLWTRLGQETRTGCARSRWWGCCSRSSWCSGCCSGTRATPGWPRSRASSPASRCHSSWCRAALPT